MYEIDFATKAIDDIAFLKKSGNKPRLKKITVFIKEIAQEPEIQSYYGTTIVELSGLG